MGHFDISETEMEIMDYLWDNPEGVKFRDVMEYFTKIKEKGWKKQTANTFLLRLSDKGMVRTEEHYSRKTYFPNLTRIEYEKNKAWKILNTYYGGSILNFLMALSGGDGVEEKLMEDVRTALQAAVKSS